MGVLTEIFEMSRLSWHHYIWIFEPKLWYDKWPVWSWVSFLPIVILGTCVLCLVTHSLREGVVSLDSVLLFYVLGLYLPQIIFDVPEEKRLCLNSFMVAKTIIFPSFFLFLFWFRDSWCLFRPRIYSLLDIFGCISVFNVALLYRICNHPHVLFIYSFKFWGSSGGTQNLTYIEFDSWKTSLVLYLTFLFLDESGSHYVILPYLENSQ